MARKSSSNSQSQSQQTGGKMSFVNYDLTLDDKAQLKKLAPKPEQVNSSLQSLIKEGYTISMSWDDYSDCIQTFLIGKGQNTVNHGFILTSRANSLEKALAALVYKHLNVFDGVWHNRVIEGKPSDDY